MAQILHIYSTLQISKGLKTGRCELSKCQNQNLQQIVHLAGLRSSKQLYMSEPDVQKKAIPGLTQDYHDYSI